MIISGHRVRGATGAARAPKPGKAPIMAARRRCRRRCRRRLLFFKIEVRPRPCRPYRVRRHCSPMGYKLSYCAAALYPVRPARPRPYLDFEK